VGGREPLVTIKAQAAVEALRRDGYAVHVRTWDTSAGPSRGRRWYEIVIGDHEDSIVVSGGIGMERAAVRLEAGPKPLAAWVRDLRVEAHARAMVARILADKED
jgi:hypothetical protein